MGSRQTQSILRRKGNVERVANFEAHSLELEAPRKNPGDSYWPSRFISPSQRRAGFASAPERCGAMKTLPSFIDEMLAAPPRAGDGVHGWLYNVARNLHAHLPAVEIIALLESRVQDCGRFVSRKGIEDAVRNSLEHAWQPKGNAAPVPSVSKWPKRSEEQRAAIIRDGYGLVDLWGVTIARIEDSTQHTEEIIDRLFPGNPLLCCGKSSQEFDTRPRGDWRGELDRKSVV